MVRSEKKLLKRLMARPTKEQRKVKRQSQEASLTTLRQQVKDFSGDCATFKDLPLSRYTQLGLRGAHFVNLTDIQKECIIPALQGHDLLVAARTGSGKTLGFLVPILERLWVERWSQPDGLGCLVITPTRELAIQIFEVLRRIGNHHTFSAGLLIGGKNVKEEKERVGRLNILVATPGRLLQHMDESPMFDTTNLQMLVLDEADRILDMGFKKTLDAIVANLPQQRQTMLFSATQTRKVSDLARLSLSNPRYISAGAVDNFVTTPKELEQYYTVVPIPEKLDTLWSFLRSHTQQKIIVFFSSSKQVRFVYEAFRRLQPGIPLLHLHGRQKQTARHEATKRFSGSRSACLIATDVVARGIDFPMVDWVVQVDCPEDSATYVHRVGRSARAGKAGRALLFLTEEEEAPFTSELRARKLEVQKLAVRTSKKGTIQSDIQAQCFHDPELKYLAQKAFISYVRSIHLQPNKQVFNVKNVPLEEYSQSLGLASAPQVKIKGSGETRKQLKNQPRALMEPSEPKEVRTKYDRIFERQNQDVLSEHYQKLHGKPEDDKEEDDEFLHVKRQDHVLDDRDTQLQDDPPSQRALKRALSKKHSAKGNPKKLLFDDEGVSHPLYEFQNEADFENAGSAEEQRAKFVQDEAMAMLDRDMEDKRVIRERNAEKKRLRKEKERLARDGEISEEEESDIGPEESQLPQSKRPKVVEVQEPETLEDLEALSRQLISGRSS